MDTAGLRELEAKLDAIGADDFGQERTRLSRVSVD